MRFSFMILVNALVMMTLGFIEFQYSKENRLLPLLFVFLGIITLSMNNVVVHGSKPVAKVVLAFILTSLILLIEPITYSYERYHMDSVYRYFGIGISNLITISILILFLLKKNRVQSK